MPQNVLVGGGGGSIPTPDKARFAMWEASTNPPDASSKWIVTNDNQLTGDGGALELGYVAPAEGNGPAYLIGVQGGGAGHNHRGYWGEPFIFPGRKATYKGILWIAYDIIAAQSQYYVGLTNRQDITDPLTGDYAMVGIEKVAEIAPVNYQFFVGVGGVGLVYDTGVPFDADRHQVEIIISRGVVSLIMDGKPVVSTSKHVPTAPLNISWYLNGTDGGGGGTSEALFEYQYAENSTP